MTAEAVETGIYANKLMQTLDNPVIEAQILEELDNLNDRCQVVDDADIVYAGIHWPFKGSQCMEINLFDRVGGIETV